ncbi:hypothetical protein KUF71_014474 [Frankliniella fusca]|uniref:Uncharacterized protein n=1 Tax=Frankliniella fusca TaxID=407009 RepID=A0AAE1LNT0_9NEOP|nr:hypothetical protein KUF71_014474 [Frankliniella fusca]
MLIPSAVHPECIRNTSIVSATHPQASIVHPKTSDPHPLRPQHIQKCGSTASTPYPNASAASASHPLASTADTDFVQWLPCRELNLRPVAYGAEPGIGSRTLPGCIRNLSPDPFNRFPHHAKGLVALSQAELEIGEVFEEWQTASGGPGVACSAEPSPPPPPPAAACGSQQEERARGQAPPPPPPPPLRSSSRNKLVLRTPEQRPPCSTKDRDDESAEPDVVVRRPALNGDATPPRASRLSSSRRRSRRGRASRRYNTDTVVQDWADDPFAAFHELVLQELAALGQHVSDQDAAGDTMRFHVSGSRASWCSSSAPASGAVSPARASPTPPDEQPWRSRWLRRKVLDDDAILVSITPLAEDAGDLEEDGDSLGGALPDLLPAARRAATLPGLQRSALRRPGSGGDIMEHQDAVKRKASLRRAAVKSAGPDLIAEDDVPPAHIQGGLPLALHNLLAKLRPSARPSPPDHKEAATPHTPANTPTSPRSPLDAPLDAPRFPVAALAAPTTPLALFPRAASPGLTADAGTQTSPALSRSSSFTWVSDCSSLPLPDTPDTPDTPGSEDDRCSSSTSSSGLVLDGEGSGSRTRAASTDDCLSSVDSAGGVSPSPTPPDSPRLERARAARASRASRESWGAAEEEGHESGIGTASPPPSHPSKSPRASGRRTRDSWLPRWGAPRSSPPAAAQQQQGQQHQGRRCDTWVRRESVETQTSSPPPGSSAAAPAAPAAPVSVASSSSALDAAGDADAAADSDNQTVDSTTSSGVDEDTGSASALSVSSLPQAARPRPRPRPRPRDLPLEALAASTRGGAHGLQSPSATSLRLSAPALQPDLDLGHKSSSAPLLVRVPEPHTGADQGGTAAGLCARPGDDRRVSI